MVGIDHGAISNAIKLVLTVILTHRVNTNVIGTFGELLVAVLLAFSFVTQNMLFRHCAYVDLSCASTFN